MVPLDPLLHVVDVSRLELGGQLIREVRSEIQDYEVEVISNK